MDIAAKPEAFEVDQDMGFLRRQWTVKRISMFAMVGIMVLGLLGVTGGSGLLSDTSITSSDGSLEVEYMRFTHLEGESRMTVQAKNPTGTELRLWLSKDFAEKVDIKRVSPEPEHIEMEKDRQ